MKFLHQNKFLRERRKQLRNNTTPEEVLLWKHLRKRGVGFKFDRQHSIGPYIVDFYCAQKKLVVELDGNQHKTAMQYDAERTRFLESIGCQVLRFWNADVQRNTKKVLEIIRRACYT